MNISIARGIAWALAATAAYVGLWAMAWPHSFFTSFPGFGQSWVAPLGPFNEHLVRDVGGLYVALLVFSGWAAVKGDPGVLRVLGWAWLAFGLPHLAFHATHRHGFSIVEWSASLAPLTFTALGAAILVLLRSNGSATAGHPTPKKEKIR
ncbi:MAG TPA: hypothetical protein VF557_08960 [Jatrophihabitans sp.]|jgi:hypothetical protein|uniref:DUF4345 family protein n=1 Tax=Jatrophihabitans sp. TaxID=1932789 RepID=UPI002F0522A2